MKLVAATAFRLMIPPVCEMEKFVVETFHVVPPIFSTLAFAARLLGDAPKE